MARVIALVQSRQRVSLAEALRVLIVCGSAAVLIAAGAIVPAVSF